MSDVERLRDSLTNFQKKLRKLQQEANIPQKRHYKRYCDLAVLPPSQLLYSDSQSSLRRDTEWVQRPIYHATVDFVYSMPDMSETSNKVKGYLDSIGFQLNPRILWDAIPYSFVVDWFFDVGGWLAKLRSDNLKVPCVVNGFCHSIKWSYRARYVYNYVGTTTKSRDFELILSDYSRLRYERRRDIPSLNALDPTLKIPSLKQVLLGASLASVNFRGR